jgi:hypothetical protein
MADVGFEGEVTRPHDYRIFFANTFSLQFTGAELIIRCAVSKDPANPKRGVDEQCALAMSPVSAKALMLTVKTIVDQVEAGGAAIPVSPELSALLEKVAGELKRK